VSACCRRRLHGGFSDFVAPARGRSYRTRKQGTPRTEQDNLPSEVRVSADSYVTIVDVDSEGGVNLLVLNNYQKRSLYGDGLLRAGETVLIPDSILRGTRPVFIGTTVLRRVPTQFASLPVPISKPLK
jgi:hypothetical protein